MKIKQELISLFNKWLQYFPSNNCAIEIVFTILCSNFRSSQHDVKAFNLTFKGLI